MMTVGDITIANATILQLQWQYETGGEIAIMRLQLLMRLSKRAETENDVLKSKEFTVV